jgi:predicted choloylglycine hydrolase
MLSVTLEGTPFERGFQHGKKFAQEIRQEIRTFCPDHWLQSKHVSMLERRLLNSLANRFPELLVEMVGISKGSGISLEQITLLNLVLATNDLDSDAIATTFNLACTAIGIPDSDVGPIVAKNCDERQSASPFYVFQTVYPEENLAFMGISNVGTVWLEAGMNEAGFSLMQTAGPIAPEQDGYGIACNIAPRPILARCRTIGESIAMLKDMYVAGWGMGLVLVDANGDVAVVEKTGDLCAVHCGGTNALFCTNHFTDSTMRDTRQIAHEGLRENSKARYQTLKVLFEDRDWPHTLASVKGALAYHGDAGFVCQHGGANLHSNYSCIAIVQEKKILLGDGYPCQNNYTQHLL